MDKNHIIIAILVIVIVSLIALLGVSFLTNNVEEIPIYNNTIEGVGMFNTTNVTNFTLDEESTNEKGTHYMADGLPIAEIVVFSQTYLMENTIDDAVRVNDSPEGHTIYKNTATIGEHKGEVRYISFLTDNEKERHILINSADYNLTCMMVDSFKMY